MNQTRDFGWHDKAGLAVLVLAATLMLTPGLGVYGDRMLQDTFKSMLVAAGSFLALGLWLLAWRDRSTRHVVWHDVMWLPLLLLVFALGSMLWSHTYLAGVEVARWTVLALIMGLTLNLATLGHTRVLLTGLHLGAVMAATWTTLQFWLDLQVFAQGPNPASTFVNRNFLAEFLVATVPLGTWLLMQAKGTRDIGILAASNAWVVLALLMTGTRSAIVALLALGPFILLWFWRGAHLLPCGQWRRPQRLWAATVFTVVVAGLGQIPCGNPLIRGEHAQAEVTALDRAFLRTATVGQPAEYRSGSFSMRVRMWHSTARMIVANPWTGVGAGAWEVQVPLFQPPDTPIEADYYAHNEPLQLLAEYGAAGWVVLLSLLIYGCISLWRTLRPRNGMAAQEVALRLALLLSLGALAFVSCAGFPLHLAATGACFAVCLGALAASDARIGGGSGWRVRSLVLPAGAHRLGLAACAVAMALTAVFSTVAALSESYIVRAVSTALYISRSGIAPSDPVWSSMREGMLDDMRRGIALNPHYRKITPLLADQLGLWGDWENAIWIWESVVASRPYVVGLHVNIARGYLVLGQLEKARGALERARALQPGSPVVRVVGALYLARSGQNVAAAVALRQLLAEGILDFDAINAAYQVGMLLSDLDLSVQAMHVRLRVWPAYTVDSWLQLGAAYAAAGPTQTDNALQAYRSALEQAPPALLAAVQQRIPRGLREALGL